MTAGAGIDVRGSLGRSRRGLAMRLGAITLGALGVGWLVDRSATPGLGVQPAAPPLSAVFEVPGSRVRVDYLGPRDFRIGLPGRSETLVVDGRVYVVQKQSGQHDRAFWVDDLDAAASPAADGFQPRPPLHEVEAPRESPDGTRRTGRYSVVGATSTVGIELTRDEDLAAIQQIIRSTLDRMDMAMCSLAVRYALDWWPEQFTAAGWAVTGTDAGLRLVGPPAALNASDRPRLAPDAEVVDLRWSVASSRSSPR